MAVMGFLELMETLANMQYLFQFASSRPQLSPPEALSVLVNHMGQIGFPQVPMNSALQQAQGQRTPNLNGSSQFASPSVSTLGLPGAQGSPHIGNSSHPSPAQKHLVGPVGLIGQQNQAGSGAGGNQAASANSSPNIHKRRRSTVKVEGDDGGGPVEINGTAPGVPKVKASPRVGGKRQKG